MDDPTETPVEDDRPAPLNEAERAEKRGLLAAADRGGLVPHTYQRLRQLLAREACAGGGETSGEPECPPYEPFPAPWLDWIGFD